MNQQTITFAFLFIDVGRKREQVANKKDLVFDLQDEGDSGNGT